MTNNTLTPPDVAEPTVAPSPWHGLALLALAQFVIALDYSVVYVALPSIGSELRMAENHLPWVVSAYAILFAGFLLLGGRMSDRYGARRLFILSSGLFGTASVVAGLAPSGELLLAARGAQGLSAALLQPSVIALITLSFRAGPARNRALAVWGTIGASGLAAGAILGGVLTTLSWRWTMLVNLPMVAACALLAPLLLLRDRADRATAHPLSAAGAVLATAASLLLVTTLTLASNDGWLDAQVLGVAAAAGLALTMFVRHERHSPTPLLAPSVRGHRWLRLGAASTALYMASVGAEFYVVTLVLQHKLHFNPLEAGLGFLPLAAMIVVGNMVAGRLASRLGGPRVLVAAFTVDAIGLIALAVGAAGDDYMLHLLPGILISGLGHGMTYTSMFITGTTGVPDQDQGTAGAILTTAQYLSAAASLAVLVLVMGESLTTWSYQAGFATTALFATVGAAVVWIGLRRMVDR